MNINEYVPILYNTCYGGFGFSDKFMTEYKKRLQERGLPPIENYIRAENLRREPLAIELYLEKGSKWCSDGFARLSLKYIHPALEDCVEIKEYDGQESVVVHTSEAVETLLKKFLDAHKNDTVADITQLRQDYDALKTLRYDEMMVTESKAEQLRQGSETQAQPESTSDTE